jgi:MFS transporter, Spinster family, sphingosine-1-phosphate transporter
VLRLFEVEVARQLRSIRLFASMSAEDVVYKRYLLTVLMLVLAFNFVDRIALGVVLDDVKRDLDLSDTDLGLMTGFAFAVFYSLMGIPLARWADRGDRVSIIAVTTGLWSVMVAMCARATSFTQLLLIRIGVAVGEAGCTPTSSSLLADHFNRGERPRASAIYALGTSIGIMVGYFGGALLSELYGWRVMFVLLGIPGVILSGVVALTLREPRKSTLGARQSDRASRPPDLVPDFLKVVVTLWRNRTYRELLFAFSVIYFFTYGILQWQPTFFIRSHALTGVKLGMWFAAIYGFGGVAGTYIGGEWASRRAANDERTQLRAMALAYGTLSIVSPFIYVVSNQYAAFGLLAFVAVCSGTVNGPISATIQTVVPERMRAVALAVILLFANLIGMGLGPLAAGFLSDTFRPRAGDESLRYALILLTPGYCWASLHLWRASRSIAKEVEGQVYVEPLARTQVQ